MDTIRSTLPTTQRPLWPKLRTTTETHTLLPSNAGGSYPTHQRLTCTCTRAAHPIDTRVVHLGLPLARPQPRGPCVTVAGDGMHTMSPFKGQSANQCLHDGRVVVTWLVSSSSLAAVMNGCMREMVQRTAPVVEASRKTAAPETTTSTATTTSHRTQCLPVSAATTTASKDSLAISSDDPSMQVRR